MRWVGAEMDWLIILLFGGVSLWILLVTPVKRWRFERFVERAVWATATVVSTRSETKSYGGDSAPVTTYHAELRFRTEEGTELLVEREMAEGVEEGDEIPVAYHVEDPYDARPDWSSDPASGLGWRAGVVVSVVFAGMGLGMLWGIGAIEVG